MKRQRGVALLSAVLVVALAVVLLAGLLDRGEASRARSRNLLRGEQTWQFVLGVELWAKASLLRARQQNNGHDAPGAVWLQPLPPVPVPGGQVSGALQDANGCFNLNALDEGGETGDAAQRRFERLLRALKLNPVIAAQAADWRDADSDTRSGGAEDARYQAQQPAYRAANGKFAHVSELRLLPAMDAKAYQTLRPHVCALPTESKTNLNFASPALWMSVKEGITEQQARALWRDGRASYGALEDVVAAMQALGIVMTVAELQTDYDVRSEYFRVGSEIRLDGLPFTYTSLLHRNPQTGMVDVLVRVRGPL